MKCKLCNDFEFCSEECATRYFEVNHAPNFWCIECHDSGIIEVPDMADPDSDAISYRRCIFCPKSGRIWKWQPIFWAVSDEIWIDNPADKAAKKLTEVPF